jgi:phosphoribosyl-AMP cyclohydrolase
MDAEEAVCRHGLEYCKFRTACLIHFIGKERKPEKEKIPAGIIGNSMVPLRFDKGGGLLPAIVQDHESGQVLMLAYINEEAWRKTLETGKAHYWSRSRNRIWLKGESSGHIQQVQEILVDCDEDTVIYRVKQLGLAACHKGYRSCFFRRASEKGLQVIAEPLFDPKEVYKK